MGQNLIQNQINKVSVLLTLASSGMPATGLIFSDLTAQFSKNGASFVAKTLTNLNFIEIGFGFYTVEFTAADCNTLGSFVLMLFNATISPNPTPIVAQVVVAASASTAASIPVCSVIGHLTDLQGAPVADAAVSARILGMPTLLNTGVVGVGISDDLTSVKTDSNGFFSIDLARSVVVDILIPAINYRRTLTVPNLASAELFTQIP